MTEDGRGERPGRAGGPGEGPGDTPRDGLGDGLGDGPAGEPVGSVAEEAAKLLSALSGFARDQAGEYAGAAGGAAGAASAAFRSVNEHLATGAPECTWCPVCQVVHAVRSTSPEVKAHLAIAANSLVQAAAAVLATRAPADAHDQPVERIDLDDDAWEDS